MRDNLPTTNYTMMKKFPWLLAVNECQSAQRKFYSLSGNFTRHHLIVCSTPTTTKVSCFLIRWIIQCILVSRQLGTFIRKIGFSEIMMQKILFVGIYGIKCTACCIVLFLFIHPDISYLIIHSPIRSLVIYCYTYLVLLYLCIQCYRLSYTNIRINIFPVIQGNEPVCE